MPAERLLAKNRHQSSQPAVLLQEMSLKTCSLPRTKSKFMVLANESRKLLSINFKFDFVLDFRTSLALTIFERLYVFFFFFLQILSCGGSHKLGKLHKVSAL